jgi:predicted alpha/beta-fold hydrolase
MDTLRRSVISHLNTDYVCNDFLPRRGLAGGHRQTLASFLLPRHDLLPVPERRRFRVEPDAEVLSLCHWQPHRESAQTLVLVHGLEGSCESQYIIGTANKAWQAGLNVVRMNVRNCGGTEDGLEWWADGTWNDGTRTMYSGSLGYIVEFEPVPEPAAITTLLFGCLGGYLARRRRA